MLNPFIIQQILKAGQTLHPAQFFLTYGDINTLELLWEQE